jgi:hypothetical protein
VAKSLRAGLTCDDAFEHTTAFLDDARGRDVTFRAGHEYTSKSFASRNDQSLVQDFGRVASAAMVR